MHPLIRKATIPPPTDVGQVGVRRRLTQFLCVCNSTIGNRGIIVNIRRGGLVDEKELVKFLVDGKLGGASLDVYENEPEVPKELFTLDNVVLSPHRAILTLESLAALNEIVIGNLKAFFYEYAIVV